MKKALKVTQSGKNGKSYFYVEKEALQNDLTTKIVWLRISEQEANEMLQNEHTVSDMTFKGDNATTIYAVNVDVVSHTEEQEIEQTLNNETDETFNTDKTIATVEAEIESTLNEVQSIELVINEAEQAKMSSITVKYMNQKEALLTHTPNKLKG